MEGLTLQESETTTYKLVKLYYGKTKIGWLAYRTNEIIYIDTIHIISKYRGNGYGSYLLCYLLNKYNGTKFEAMILGGISNVESIGLFEKYGFIKYFENSLFMRLN